MEDIYLIYQDLMTNHGYKYEDVENLDIDGFLKVWSVGNTKGKAKKAKSGELSPEEVLAMF